MRAAALKRKIDALGGLAARRIDELSQQIAQSQERMKLAVRAGNVGVWGLDMASQRFDWDEQMHALYESRPEGFAYAPGEWLNLLVQEDRARVTQAWNATVGRGVPFEQEFRVLTRDGQTRHLKGLAQAFTGADGRTVRVLETHLLVLHCLCDAIDLQLLGEQDPA